jgi:flagellar assembly protein FliH
MVAPAKFMFDMDFSPPDKARERPATPAEIAQKIASAEARAYRDGFEAAQREAKAESDRRAALALEEIGITIKGIASRFSGIEARMETEAVDVAVAVARKLCGELVAAEPLGEITGLVSDCFSQLVATPHLVVRVNEQLYEAARERIERLAKQSGFDILQIKFAVCAPGRNQFRAAREKLRGAALVCLAMCVFVANDSVKRPAKLGQGQGIRRGSIKGQEDFAIGLESVAHLCHEKPAPFVVAVGNFRRGICFDQRLPGCRRNGGCIVTGKLETFRCGHGRSPNRLRAFEQRAKRPRPASYGHVLGATAQQKKQKQNRNRNSKKPKQNVSGRSLLFDFVFQFHIPFDPFSLV